MEVIFISDGSREIVGKESQLGFVHVGRDGQGLDSSGLEYPRSDQG